jgi:uncharacterized protein (TIGR02996 family)
MKIKLDGKQLVITSDGKRTVRTFVTAEQALAQRDKLVAQHAQEVADGRRTIRLDDPRHPELEQVIVNAPEDRAGYAILADWLQSQGDPRGTLMALQLAPEPHSKEHAAAISRAIAAHPAYYYGPLAVHRKHYVVDWHFGFIRRVNLGSVESGEPAEVLEQVLSHPSGRFLVDVNIHFRGGEPKDAQPVVEVLERRAPPTLRSVHIVAKPGLDLRRLWSALPRLRYLGLANTRSRIGALSVPELESLRLVDDAVESEEITTFTRASWPALKRLSLSGPSRQWLVELPGMLERVAVLEHFEISDAGDLGELLRVLPETPAAAQLVSLFVGGDMSRRSHGLTDAQAIELARQRDRFPRLTKISAWGHRLSTTGVAALRTFDPQFSS